MLGRLPQTLQHVFSYAFVRPSSAMVGSWARRPSVASTKRHFHVRFSALERALRAGEGAVRKCLRTATAQQSRRPKVVLAPAASADRPRLQAGAGGPPEDHRIRVCRFHARHLLRTKAIAFRRAQLSVLAFSPPRRWPLTKPQIRRPHNLTS